MPFDAPTAPRAVLATRRFLRERRAFTAKYPAFDAALRGFVRFRAAATTGEPYDAKDGRMSGSLPGYRRWHAVHGKAVVLYDIAGDAVRLLAVVEHDALDRPAAAVALRDAFAASGADDFTPAPLLLADAETEAAFEALRDEAHTLRARLAEERAARARAEADTAAAMDLAHAEQARREAAEAEVGGVAAGVTAPPHEPFGVWLRRTRMERGLTQQRLAAMVGLSGPAICRYEAGHEPGLPESRAAIEAALAGL